MEQQSYERELDFKYLFGFISMKVKIIMLAGLTLAIILGAYKVIEHNKAVAVQPAAPEHPTTNYVGEAKIYLGDDINANLAETMRTYLTGRNVIIDVINNLGLNNIDNPNTGEVYRYIDIFNMITLWNSTDTIIVISVVGQDENLVHSIADKLSIIGTEKLKEKFNLEEIMLLEPAFTVLKPAIVTPVVPITFSVISLIKYMIIGFIVGAICALGVFVVIHLLDQSIRNEKDVLGYLGVPVLAAIPVIKGTKKEVCKAQRKKNRRLSQYKNK